MGGFFSPQQTPAQIIDVTPRALWPFREEFVRAVAGLLGQAPFTQLSPLEESAILGIAGGAPDVLGALHGTASGRYLPGQAGENPFTGALIQAIEAQGDAARRQLAAAAQRAGALTGTDYMQQAAGLEAQLAQKKGEVLADLWNQERARQLQAAGMFPSVGGGLVDLFGLGRRARQQAIDKAFDVGIGLLGGQRSAVQPGETRPSPFASLLSGLAPFVPLVVK